MVNEDSCNMPQKLIKITFSETSPDFQTAVGLIKINLTTEVHSIKWKWLNKVVQEAQKCY